MSIPAHPNSSDVRRAILSLQARHANLVRVQTIQDSAEGRPIDAVFLTDPRAADSQKQRVLIVAGQHGNEETGRLVALKLMQHLVSPAGRATLRKQQIVVMPNVSPDAAERDSYETPAGIRPNLDHGEGGPVSPEARAVAQMLESLAPEVFVDVHARGHAGCSYDMVLYPPTKEYTEDDNLLHAIAADMVCAGEKAGIPHVTHPLSWSGWGGSDLAQPSSTCFAYRRYKSIVLLTENAEHNKFAYPDAMRSRSGVSRLKALLAWGQRRHPSLYYAGYPGYLASGTFTSGLVAVGQTAAARRDSRVELWRNAPCFRRISAELPEQAKRKALLIEYAGPPLNCGAGFQVRAAGKLRVKSVRFDETRLKPSEIDGYYSWHDRCSTYVVAATSQLQAGAHRLDVVFH